MAFVSGAARAGDVWLAGLGISSCNTRALGVQLVGGVLMGGVLTGGVSTGGVLAGGVLTGGVAVSPPDVVLSG